MPYCEGCQACVSVRVLADRFEPSRSFRRIESANADLVARRIAPRPTSEQYSLFRSYIDARHSDGGMADMTVLDYAMMVEDSIVDTFITEYRLQPSGHDAQGVRLDGWPLIAVALTDRLSDGLSMVYSFYDPELAHRSLGGLTDRFHLPRDCRARRLDDEAHRSRLSTQGTNHVARHQVLAVRDADTGERLKDMLSGRFHSVAFRSLRKE